MVDGNDFHRSTNLIHPDFAVADHDALIAGEQIVGLGGSDGGLDLGREDPRVVGAQGSGIYGRSTGS